MKWDDILNGLNGLPGVKGAILLTIEGLPIASALPQGVDETRIAAMTAALFCIAERSFVEMKKGEFNQLHIKGSDGSLLIMPAGPIAILALLTTNDVRLGHIFFNSGGGSFPYPYIFKPPSPPEDLGLSGQLQVKKERIKGEAEDEFYCKHCGAPIAEGETVCHVCGKKVL